MDFENLDNEAVAAAMAAGTPENAESPAIEIEAPAETSYSPPAEEAADATTETVEATTPPPATEEATTSTTDTTAPADETSKPVEVIKEVEKIIEKQPEFKNEKSKQLFEQLTNAEDPKEAEKTVLEYLREKNRDYSVMSDIDVVKAALRKENPTWTKDDVDLKIRRTYGKDLTTIDLSSIDADLEPEKYDKAKTHNEDVENALADLRLDALQKRPVLIQAQQELELPSIKPSQQEPPAVGPTPEEVEAANKQWLQAVDSSLSGLSEIKQSIDNKEVVYALNDEDKTALKSQMETFNLLDFSKKRGWQNEDGTPNVTKLAEDVLKLQNFDKITKSYAGQIKTEATKDVLKSIKNVDDAKRPPQEVGAGSFEEAFFSSQTK